MRSSTCLAVLLFLFSDACIADEFEGNESAPRIRNVELTKNAELLGRVVDETGAGQSGTTVLVTVAKQTVRAVADSSGRFRVRMPKGGV